MNRPADLKIYKILINKIKKLPRLLTLGTDIIVGFPGETDADFRLTKKMASNGFNYFHIFPFSPRPGTTAAQLPFKLAKETIKTRAQILKEETDALNLAYRRQYLQRTVQVVVEKKGKDYFTGTSGAFLKLKVQAPAPASGAALVKINKIEPNANWAQLVI
jgi:threonylcarbamoyladenosine tRNA methylthiotransferase MtaB